MAKHKPLPYKRGDPVLYIYISWDYGARVSEGVVTAIRNNDLVYVKSVSVNGWVSKNCFSRDTKGFWGSKYPLWAVRPKASQDNFKKLEKRVQKLNEEYRAYRNAIKEMEWQVEREAADWKRQEMERRRKEIPGGIEHVYRVMARMGFRQNHKH